MNWPKSSSRHRHLKVVLLFAALHYGVLLGVSGLIFLTGHIPPKAVNLETALSALVGVETVLEAPRKGLIWLWPWETTPTGFGALLTLINSLTWGVGLAGLRAFWQRATR